MATWPILLLLCQSAILGLIACYACSVLRRINRPVTGAPPAPAPTDASTNYREVQSLLSLVSHALSEHSGDLGQFERSLASSLQASPAPESDEVEGQLQTMRHSNQKLEQAIDNTVAGLVTASGGLLAEEQSSLSAYRNQTQSFDAMLHGVNRETLLAAIATKLVEMVRDLRVENAAVRTEVAQAKDRTIELMARAHSAEQTARTDALTQLPNRRSFDETHTEFHDHFERAGERYALVLMDLDYFKSVNDQYGHAVGDAVLTMIGRVFMENRRTTDLLCRMGGEEFALLLPKCDIGVASVVAERYREKVEMAVLRVNDHAVSVTVSCGVAVPKPGDTKGRVIERADRALYAAKSQGRNRVSVDPNGTPAGAAPLTQHPVHV